MNGGGRWWDTPVLPPGLEVDEPQLGPESVREIAAALRRGQAALAASAA